MGNANIVSVQCYNAEKGAFETMAFEENEQIAGWELFSAKEVFNPTWRRSFPLPRPCKGAGT